MTTRRWAPDPQLIMSARSGGVRGATLQSCDRAWAVALLMEGEQHTGQETAELLRCSLRLVRLIRADPLYPLAAHAASLERQLHDTETAASRQLRHMSQQNAQLKNELVRVKSQRDQLINDLATARTASHHYSGNSTA